MMAPKFLPTSMPPLPGANRFLWLLRWGTFAVAVLFWIFIVLRQVDLRSSLSIVLKADKTLLALAVLGHILMGAIKTWRWGNILQRLKVCVPWLVLFPIYLISSYLSSVVPAYAGEATRVLFIRRRGHGYGPSFSAYFIDRLWDALILSVIIFCVLAVRPGVVPLKLAIFFCSALIIPMALLSFFYRKIEFLSDFWTTICGCFLSSFGTSLAATLGLLITYILTNYALLASLGVFMRVQDFALCLAALMGVAAVPISISGIGTREASMIFLFARLGLSLESALAYSLLELFLIHGVAGSLALCAWVYLAMKGDDSEMSQYKPHLR